MSADAEHWESALEYTAERLNHVGVSWMLVGSAATAIHGATLSPGDIDILLPTPAAVHVAAGVLPSRPEPWATSDPGTWQSSVAHPVLTWTDGTDTTWTFGRWTVEGTKVELANLQSAAPSRGLIETRPSNSMAIERTWHGLRLPIVPLEVQLGTMVVRDQQDRLRAVLAVTPARALDAAMLRRVIADRQIDATDPRIPDALVDLLKGA